MMRRRIISAILLFIIILFSQAYFNQCTAAIPKAGQVIFIEGAVQIKRAGTNAWAKAEEFDALYNNDEIKTLKNSTAEIEFTHGDIVLISSSSHFKIQNYNVDKNQRTADFLLSIGKTWANVKKAKGKGSKFKINTPVGAASVRGTLFVVEVLPKDLTKPPTPENLEIAIAAIDGKIDVDTSFDKKIINPLKEVNFTHKDQKLNIQNIKQAYLKEAQNVIKIINQLQNKLMDESKTGEKIADLKKNTEQQVSIIDNTKIGTVINLIQQNNTLDSDNDGLPDALEIKLGYNPNNSDTDGNGKPDGEEDFDSDDILNKDESKWGYDPKVAQAKDLDTDEDSLPDILEINNFASYNTNPKLKNNLDIDNDNISNAFEVAQQNLGFPMDPFEKNLFSDRVDANYKTINANYGINSLKYIDIDKINDYLGNVNDNISAIKAGDGIGDFDEIILKDIIKGYYKIDDTKDSGKKLLLDPTYFNLAELVNRVKEYKTICQTQQNPWNDLDNYKLDYLYNPANWNFTLIKNKQSLRCFR